MDFYDINGEILIYDDENHKYYLNGQEILSVTNAMKKVNDKYKMISPRVLLNAQLRGNRVHHEIMMYEQYGSMPLEESQEFNNYLLLKKIYNWKTIDSERPVIIKYNGITLAGRYDICFELDDDVYITDVKTSCSIDKNFVALQTALYSLGREQSYPNDKKAVKTAGIHLNKGEKKLHRYLPNVNIDMFFENLKKVLEEE